MSYRTDLCGQSRARGGWTDTQGQATQELVLYSVAGDFQRFLLSEKGELSDYRALTLTELGWKSGPVGYGAAHLSECPGSRPGSTSAPALLLPRILGGSWAPATGDPGGGRASWLWPGPGPQQ